MAITRDTVLHVAKLARLQLEDHEIPQLTRDLAQIVSYIDQLAELDTRNVPATTQVAVSRAPLREDRVVAGLTPELALREGPRTSDGSFAVPAFVEEG